MYGGFANWFTTGSRTGSREFARVRESSREFARVCESLREFARVRESSREFARVREGSPGFAKDTRMDSQRIYGARRICGLTQIDGDSRTDSQWVHKGSNPMFTVRRCESVYGI